MLTTLCVASQDARAFWIAVVLAAAAVASLAVSEGWVEQLVV
jgi:hypothetical protein